MNLCNVSRPSSSGNVARRIRKTAGGSDLQTAIFAVLSSFPTSVRCRSAVHIPVRLIDSDEEAGNGCKLKAISWDFPTVPRVEANCDCRRASPLINLFFRLSRYLTFIVSQFFFPSANHCAGSSRVPVTHKADPRVEKWWGKRKTSRQVPRLKRELLFPLHDFMTWMGEWKCYKNCIHIAGWCEGAPRHFLQCFPSPSTLRCD